MEKQRFRETKPLPRASQKYRGSARIWTHAYRFRSPSSPSLRDYQDVGQGPSQGWDGSGLARAWPVPLQPGTSGLPSGHKVNRAGSESEDKQHKSRVFVRWEMTSGTRYWLGEEKTLGMWQLSSSIWRAVMRKKNETYSLKGLQGVEIKVMDGSDNQSDVSSVKERLLHWKN